MSTEPRYLWKVAPETTGYQRAWPTASYLSSDPHNNGRVCAQILCAETFVPWRARSGTHSPLTLRIADHSHFPYKWLRSKKTFATLEQAKAELRNILERHPHLAGKGLI